MGMWLFVLVVGMFFAAGLLGAIVVRITPSQWADWKPENAAPLPTALVFSTLVLLASGVALQRALVAVRRGAFHSCSTAAQWAYWLGCGFVILQGVAWWSMWQSAPIGSSLYAWTFYVLTGLHVLHVLGGIHALGVVAGQAGAHRYTREHHNGLVLCSIYWHSLDAIWLVLYATLWVASR